MLRAFDIKYLPHTVVKGQVLVDLVEEITEGVKEIETKKREVSSPDVLVISTPYLPLWEIYVNGAASQKGSGVEIVLVALKKITMEKSLRLGFLVTNNEVKYEALLAGITMVKRLKGKVVEVFSNSRLVVGQINGDFEASDQRMQGYLSKVRQLQSNFEAFSIKQVPRSKNSQVDSLATLGTSSRQGLPRVIIVEDLVTTSCHDQAIVGIHSIQVGLDWMDPLVSFLSDGALPEDKSEAKKIQRKAPRYWLSKEQKLYEYSFSRPYLLYVHSETVEPLLEEL